MDRVALPLTEQELVSGESRGRTGGQKEPAAVPAGHSERLDQGSDNRDVEERGRKTKTLPGLKAGIAGVRKTGESCSTCCPGALGSISAAVNWLDDPRPRPTPSLLLKGVNWKI